MAVPTIEVGQQIETQLIYSLDAQTCINTFHWRCTAKTGTEGFFQRNLPPLILEYFWRSDALNQGIDELVSQDLRLRSVTAQVLRPTRLIKSVTTVADEAGLVLTTSSPSGVSAVIRRQGGLATRSNFGRIYLPGIPFDSTSESQLTATALPKFIDFAERLSAIVSFIDPDTAAGITLQPIVAIKPTIAETADIASGTVDPIIRYQRRREVGVGL